MYIHSAAGETRGGFPRHRAQRDCTMTLLQAEGWGTRATGSPAPRAPVTTSGPFDPAGLHCRSDADEEGL